MSSSICSLSLSKGRGLLMCWAPSQQASENRHSAAKKRYVFLTNKANKYAGQSDKTP